MSSHKYRDIEGRVSARKVRLSGDYDSRGRYWGSHSPGSILYRVSDASGNLDEYVRAGNAKEALEKLSIPSIHRKASKKRERLEAARRVSERRARAYADRHPEVYSTIAHYRRAYGENISLAQAVREHIRTRTRRSR